MNLTALSEIAIRAARAAGALIRQRAAEELVVSLKTETGGTSYAAQVVTEVDRACEALILSHLKPTLKSHDLGLLSEETEDDGSRFVRDYFWCIDPLDGTLPFLQRRSGYAVAIALVARDGTPRIGVVCDPTTETIYHATRGGGAFKNGQPWHIERTNNHFTYVTDRTLAKTPRRPEIEQLLTARAAELGLTKVRELAGGGSVMNAIRVLENGPACLLKFPKPERGGGGIWDFAATVCLFHELQLPATDFFGQPLDLNRADGVFMNHRGVFFANW